MNKPQILLIILSLIFLVPTIGMSDEPLVPDTIMKNANIKNGESLYVKGKRKDGAHLAFTGGPNWLHVNGGGCVECHGKRGWGNTTPMYCTSKTPPIAFRYLAGDGYPSSTRKDGSHPVYTMYSFKVLMRNGVKANGYDADFCMPRYHISNEELIDILGYLIELDYK